MKSPSYDDSFYAKISDVLDSLDNVQSDSAVLLYEELKDRTSNLRLLSSVGKEVEASREVVEYDAWVEGYKTALMVVEKNFHWLSTEKKEREASSGKHTSKNKII